MLFSYGIFIFFLGWPLKASQSRALWTFFLIILAAIAVVGAAIALNLPHADNLRVLGVVGHEESVGGDMFFGWYEAHNTAGGIYAVASVLALLWVQEPKMGWKERWFRWCVFGACLVGLVITYSRGAYIAFAAGALLVVPLRNLRRTARIGIFVAVPVLLMTIMGSDFLGRVDTITDPYWGTNAQRLDIWKDALKDFGDSPLIGIGYGRYNDIWEQFEGVKHIVWVAYKGIIVNDDEHAHNSYLHFLAEGGIVGLVLTLLVWRRAWQELVFFESHFPRSHLAMLLKGARASLVVGLVQSLTEHMIGRGSLVLVLDALIGITLAAARIEAKQAALAAAKSKSAAPAPRPRPRFEPAGVR
jgi:O-antigen ligase